jgi:serine/threonine-protein kinase
MSTHGNLLFGLVALQSGAVEADQLTEACAQWSADESKSLADRLVDRGCMTVEQKSLVEALVVEELDHHGGDAAAALAATVDGRFLEAVRDLPAIVGGDEVDLGATLAQVSNYEVVGPASVSEDESSDRYTRTRLHAKGGMGQVWVARDATLGRQVALKELRPDSTDNSVVCSRFLYEAKITAQLEHPGIVPVYELGGGPVPYYTMRFVNGRTLSEATRAYHKVRSAGTADSIGLIKLLSAFLGVCHAVAYAHSRGVIHRDLKGQNVILGDFGEVIVLDWGIAKQIGPLSDGQAKSIAEPPDVLAAGGTDRDAPDGLSLQDTLSARDAAQTSSDHSEAVRVRPRFDSGAGLEGTLHGQLLGTPGFMAPEQAGGQLDEIDERTDVYGLGAVLYEILTGTPPFKGKKTIEILRQVQEHPPEPPHEVNPTLDRTLQAICLKALAKRKEDRYSSATELANDIERYLADEPVRACPDPLSRKAMRWARRHRTAVATAAGLLVTSVIALSVGTVMVTRERNEADLRGKQARQAVDDMYTKVAENWLEDRLDPLQTEFLEKTLAHYQTLTGQAARNPAVQLENGSAFQRMGEIHRKLGRLEAANDAFRRALDLLEPLNAARPGDGAIRRALGLTRTRLGDLLVRQGHNDQAEPLYQQAIALQEAQIDRPNPAVEDRWLLGRSNKSRADLLRRKGDFAGARLVYQQAIFTLQRAADADPKLSDVRNDLALAEDALGQLLMEMGETRLAEEGFRRAMRALEPLVAQFPTIPRFREALVKASNSLGMIEQADGRWADSEAHYRRELDQAERLTQDFPDRPEFRRELARGWTNLGGLLAEQSRAPEAEAALRRAISLNADLTSKQPADVQVRLDLAKCRNNLGYLLLEKGQIL